MMILGGKGGDGGGGEGVVYVCVCVCVCVCVSRVTFIGEFVTIDARVHNACGSVCACVV